MCIVQLTGLVSCLTRDVLRERDSCILATVNAEIITCSNICVVIAAATGTSWEGTRPSYHRGVCASRPNLCASAAKHRPAGPHAAGL